MYKQTIIIFEGHDMSGKTHIAEALSKKLNIPIFKMNRTKYFWDPLSYQTYATEAITQMLEQTKQSVILDRSFPSDYLYSKLFKRPYDYEKHWITDGRFAAMDTLIVYCYKNEEFYLHDEEDKEFISVTDYNRMKAIYDDFFISSCCRHCELNTSDENLDEQLSIIMKYI